MDGGKISVSRFQRMLYALDIGAELLADLTLRAAGRRVAFADEISHPPIRNPPKRLYRFCEIMRCDDDGSRISLKLEDGVLVRLGAEALKHHLCQGKDVSLADVLTRYTLSIKEKLALSYVISLAFWQYYGSPLMHRAWNSHTVWFMHERDPRDASESLPLRVYISFYPEITECEFDAFELAPQVELAHRCPRIQSLATLLLEIGLNEPFRCMTFDRHVTNLNYRYAAALKNLEDLKSTKWDFSYQSVFTNAVEQCLKFDGLMGKQLSSDNTDSHAYRREMLYRLVVSPLKWLIIDESKCYLSNKRVLSGPILDTDSHTNGNSTSATIKKSLDQSSLKPGLAIRTHLPINDHSSTKDQPAANESKSYLSTTLRQPGKWKRPTHQRDFGIAILCALPIEANAIEALFDEYWDDDWPCYSKAAGDSNTYTTGSIGPHNVVLIHMPSMGKGSAASVAANCRVSFPGIRLAIVVGVCGIVPYVPGTKDEIILGDVIVSDGIIQYDLGRRLPDRFERKDTLLDSLGRPNNEIRGVLAKLRGNRSRGMLLSNMNAYLNELRKDAALKAEYPGTQNDKLFGEVCNHATSSMACQASGCRRDQPVSRSRLDQDAPQPAVHFGLIASGDTVMKSREERDSISQRENVVGFEMEGAGVWDIFPCVVIKGACDYADSHKTKVFQPYAAATAASCAKAFLKNWVPSGRD
ncbi:unnamed protein product [Clonostachys rosea]|uniref:Nucleoside phosphorylase domain-containing protein n=1 Tax=Bionectria ochroleuca TaxID=29856 RepID=A0ABY6UN37_BIOOC|nr:unnamed protein product [Clonostachys rosea]